MLSIKINSVINETNNEDKCDIEQMLLILIKIG